MIRGHLTADGEIIYKEDDSNCIWTIVVPRDGKYTVKIEKESVGGLYFTRIFNDKISEPYVRLNPGQKGVLTLKKGENKIQASSTSALRPIGNEKVMLSYGDQEPPTYEAYQEPQTLTLTSDRPLTKWDKLVEQGGEYGWLYGTGKITLTGNEKWIAYSDYKSFYTVDYDILLKPNPYCTHYIYGNPLASDGNNVYAIGVGAYYNSLWIKDNRFNMNLQDFKAYLSDSYTKGNPVTVLYNSKPPNLSLSYKKSKHNLEICTAIVVQRILW